MLLKPLSVWLGAALGGSILGTALSTAINSIPGPWDFWGLFHWAWGLGLITTLFTIPGSAMLFLIYSWLRKSKIAVGWCVVSTVVMGSVVGGLVTSLGGGGLAWLGTLYGFSTSICWAGLAFVASGFSRKSPTTPKY